MMMSLGYSGCSHLRIALCKIIKHYVSHSTRILLADSAVYDTTNRWHIQAITETEMWREVAGWLSVVPIPLIGETRLQHCLTIEG